MTRSTPDFGTQGLRRRPCSRYQTGEREGNTMKTTYSVLWDNSNGIDWDETFDNLRVAYDFYKKLPASVPYKKLVSTDPVNGDRMLVNSKGENNLSKYYSLVEYA